MTEVTAALDNHRAHGDGLHESDENNKLQKLESIARLSSPEIWVGVCGPLLQTLTLFQTKMCDFSYPISDLTQNSLRYFRPVPYSISFAETFENFFKFPTLN